MKNVYGTLTDLFIVALQRAGWTGDAKILKRFIISALWPAEGQGGLRIWKTIKLGVGPRTPDGFLGALKKARWNVTPCAVDMLCNSEFTVSHKEIEVELGVISITELGYKDNAPRKEIYKRIKELGWELCPAEVAVQLCLQAGSDFRKDDWRLIGMDPIFNHIFDVGRRADGTLVLDGDHGHHDRHWHGHEVGVFMRYLS